MDQWSNAQQIACIHRGNHGQAGRLVRGGAGGPAFAQQDAMGVFQGPADQREVARLGTAGEKAFGAILIDALERMDGAIKIT